MDSMDNSTSEFKSLCDELIKNKNIRVITLNEITRYDNKELIGEGSQAEVYIAKLGDIDVAIKLLTNVDWKCFWNELIILSKIEHDNIPKFYGIITENNKIQMVFQYIKGKSLDLYHGHLNLFSESEKLGLVKSLASALEVIHKNNFIHRDLKPENIMIDSSNKLYVIDFGISKVIDEGISVLTRAKGSTYFLSPEVFVDESEEDSLEIISRITPKVDIWAFGCIVSYIFSDIIPWTQKFSNNEDIVLSKIRKRAKFPIPNKIVNKDIKKIISMCTEVKKDKRPDITEIIKILEDIKIE